MGGWEWYGGPPGGQGVVGRPSRMAWSGQEAFPEGREWSGDPMGGPGVVWRSSRMPGSGLEALLEGRDLTGVSPRGS